MTEVSRLSAQLLDTWDRCERRYAFEQEFEPTTISPTGLLYRCLDAGLISGDPEETAKATALRIISRMELTTTALDAYSTAIHIGHMAGIISTALRMKLGTLDKLATVETEDFEWNSDLYVDESDNLHRVTLVSHWDDERLTSEAHSWLTIGELAALQQPLTLHAVVIGPTRGGRRHSPWSKGYLHPVSSVLRFQRRANKTETRHANRAKGPLNDNWKEIWRETKPEISTQTWLRIMQEDGVLGEVILSRRISLDASDPRLLAARRELVHIQSRMEQASPQSPMRRSSCDEVGRGPCPFQTVCYSPVKVEPSDLVHLYRPRQWAVPRPEPQE